VDCAWNVAAQGEQDIDDEVNATAAADEYCDRWEQDREDDEEDVRGTHLNRSCVVRKLVANLQEVLVLSG